MSDNKQTEEVRRPYRIMAFLVGLLSVFFMCFALIEIAFRDQEWGNGIGLALIYLWSASFFLRAARNTSRINE